MAVHGDTLNVVAGTYNETISVPGTGTANVTNCTFINNNGGIYGGGMWSHDNPANVTNCLFVGNAGGGMLNEVSDVKVTHCTFSGNYGGFNQGNAMFNYGCNPVITNCIIQGAIGNQGGASPFVTYSVAGYPGTGNIDADPQFVDPAGGNYRLQFTSPGIDAGSAAAPNLPGSDLIGEDRIRGSAPDMGAYETWLPSYGLYVDKVTGNDTGTGSPLLPFATVVKAITVANSGSSIYIKAGNYGTDKPRITKALSPRNWGNTGQARIGKP